MRTNSITEHFPKIVKDYMVTSFTGQKLDQSFGDQYWEFPDEGALMQVFEAIADVAEDLIKDYEERIKNLNEGIQAVTHRGNVDEAEPAHIPLQPLQPLPPPVEPEPKVRKKRGPNKKKPCVACEGSGNNSKGEICPICTKVEEPTLNPNKPIEATLDGQPPFTPPASVPPWLAPKVEPAAPAFFPPPPPPPVWNPVQ